MVERLFLAVPRGCLRFVFVVFPDHTHLLFVTISSLPMSSQVIKIGSIILSPSESLAIKSGPLNIADAQ